jgi:hypothetical protein
MSKNRMHTTLTPIHYRLVKATAYITGKSQSQVIAEAVKQRFDALSQSEKERLLNK